MLEPDEFFIICDAIKKAFAILPGAEFTIESNPKTLTREKLLAYISCGVNRISIGLQSIHEKELKMLGRIHTFDEFLEAYNIVLELGIRNINVDVMYGIPEQTSKSFEETLRVIVKLNPAHISAYGLILEKNTGFWSMRDKLRLPSEDEECDMYALACKVLSSNGYRHYEISNYAKEGFESRHNMKYWLLRDYIGVGASAYSCFERYRYGNSRNIEEYILSCEKQYKSEEFLDNKSLAYEYVMLGFRLSEGISLSEYRKLFGHEFFDGREQKIESYVKNGYMLRQNDRLALTEKGFFVSNAILVDLL